MNELINQWDIKFSAAVSTSSDKRVEVWLVPRKLVGFPWFNSKIWFGDDWVQVALTQRRLVGFYSFSFAEIEFQSWVFGLSVADWKGIGWFQFIQV